MQDTYTSEGVNSSTGDIQFDGAVVVNGDVGEDREINASGDVTINGFVESAYIHSGGDIIISEGAIGKMHDEDCRLVASGSVYVHHAQGLNIQAGTDVNIGTQLAYSSVKCKGSVTVGSVEHPAGNLFASSIECGNSVSAGIIGAISGSTLILDFSEGYNIITSRIDALSQLSQKLINSNASHELSLSTINKHFIPELLKQKVTALNDMIEAESVLLEWLKQSIQNLQVKQKSYQENARVTANEELFPGVSVKLNNNIWRCEREYLSSQIMFKEGKWVHKLIN